jgi:hypothetical protein
MGVSFLEVALGELSLSMRKASLSRIPRFHRYGYDSVDDEESKANARLIAAAPDLLAACKAVVEEDGFRGSALMRKRIDAMKEAIAKAEGGSS